MKLLFIYFLISIITVIFTQSKYFGFVEQFMPQYNNNLYIVKTVEEHDKKVVDKLYGSTENTVYQKSIVSRQMEINSKDGNIEEFEHILLSSEDVDERIHAITQLGFIGGKNVVPVIALALNDESVLLRSFVIETLSELDINHTAHLLGQVLFNEKEQELKLQALNVLAASNSSVGLSLLQYFSLNAEDDVIRSRASEVAMHRDPEIEEVKEDFYAIMQQVSVLPTKEELHKLDYIIKKSPDVSLRNEAVLALANSHEIEAISIIENALADQSSDVRYQAIHALTSTEINFLPVLGQVFFSDPDPELRMEALNFIALENTPASHAFLVLGLKDEDEGVRELVTYYLNTKD